MSDTNQTNQPTGTEQVSTGRLTAREAADMLVRERIPEGTDARKPDDEASQTPPPAQTADTSADTSPEPAEPAATETETPDTGTAETDASEDDESDPIIEIGNPDKPERVKFSELRNGYLRQKDYTQKTMALADQAKAFQQHQSAVQSERQAYALMMTALQDQIVGQDKAIDWAKLEAEDPLTYVQERQRAADRQARLNAITSEQQRLQATAQQEQAQRMAQAEQASRQFLLNRVPEWAKPETAQKEITELRTFAASSYGFTEQQLDLLGTADPRLVLVMRDLYRASRAQGKGPVAAKRVPPVAVRSIGRQRSTPTTDINAARKQAASAAFTSNPSLKNAVEALVAEREGS